MKHDLSVFPTKYSINSDLDFTEESLVQIYRDHAGLSLRDYFAAAALHSLCAFDNGNEVIARKAYSIADAMLEERGK